jgi:hypothetical protein
MVRGATQNAGSEKKQSSNGSWDYAKSMRELDCQSSKKRVAVLADKLAEQIYDSIRECDTDICDIPANLGFKADTIKNVKSHVFYNEYDLDRFAPAEPVEHRRFDANLQQTLAWKRLETGIHTQNDMTWIKDDCSERHHELNYN